MALPVPTPPYALELREREEWSGEQRLHALLLFLQQHAADLPHLAREKIPWPHSDAPPAGAEAPAAGGG